MTDLAIRVENLSKLYRIGARQEPYRTLRDIAFVVKGDEEVRRMPNRARDWSNHYIPPRYPYSHPEGAPFEHYGPLHSEEAIRYAGEILEFVRSQMA